MAGRHQVRVHQARIAESVRRFQSPPFRRGGQAYDAAVNTGITQKLLFVIASARRFHSIVLLTMGLQGMVAPNITVESIDPITAHRERYCLNHRAANDHFRIRR